jgi:hypothetical protein
MIPVSLRYDTCPISRRSHAARKATSASSREVASAVTLGVQSPSTTARPACGLQGVSDGNPAASAGRLTEPSSRPTGASRTPLASPRVLLVRGRFEAASLALHVVISSWSYRSEKPALAARGYPCCRMSTVWQKKSRGRGCSYFRIRIRVTVRRTIVNQAELSRGSGMNRNQIQNLSGYKNLILRVAAIAGATLTLSLGTAKVW